LLTTDDERVQLTMKPWARVAVLRYRVHQDANTMVLELLAALRRAGLHDRVNPQLAGCGPPATLPLAAAQRGLGGAAGELKVRAKANQPCTRASTGSVIGSRKG
jgi:hypothetical protein